MRQGAHEANAVVFPPRSAHGLPQAQGNIVSNGVVDIELDTIAMHLRLSQRKLLELKALLAG